VTAVSAVELHDAWCSDACEPSTLGAFEVRAAALRAVQDAALYVEPVELTAVTVAQLDAEPTPLYAAALAAHEDRTTALAA
jgi:hypothetical protein